MPRFHVDESVTPEVAEGLRRRGRDCTTTQGAGLMGVSDVEQLAYARQEGRVLITADQDFLRLARRDSNHPGVVFWTGIKHFGQVITLIDELCFSSTAEDWVGRVEYV